MAMMVLVLVQAAVAGTAGGQRLKGRFFIFLACALLLFF
jgi:hypothetical protein